MLFGTFLLEGFFKSLMDVRLDFAILHVFQRARSLPIFSLRERRPFLLRAQIEMYV